MAVSFQPVEGIVANSFYVRKIAGTPEQVKYIAFLISFAHGLSGVPLWD